MRLSLEGGVEHGGRESENGWGDFEPKWMVRFGPQWVETRVETGLWEQLLLISSILNPYQRLTARILNLFSSIFNININFVTICITDSVSYTYCQNIDQLLMTTFSSNHLVLRFFFCKFLCKQGCMGRWCALSSNDCCFFVVWVVCVAWVVPVILYLSQFGVTAVALWRWTE